jgi:hypothetical protein
MAEHFEQREALGVEVLKPLPQSHATNVPELPVLLYREAESIRVLLVGPLSS